MVYLAAALGWFLAGLIVVVAGRLTARPSDPPALTNIVVGTLAGIASTAGAFAGYLLAGGEIG